MTEDRTRFKAFPMFLICAVADRSAFEAFAAIWAKRNGYICLSVIHVSA